MLDKLEWIANHILTRVFGGVLMGGAAYSLYDGLVTQWPALGIFVFGLFCAVPTKFKDFFSFMQEKKDALLTLFKG